MNHPAATILPHPELASSLSEDDVAALSKLSNASQVWAWTRRMVAAHEKYISTLLDIQNSITPIDDLPPEILQMVFAYVSSEEAWWRDSAWILSLQSVCRRWRSVLLATPEYWAQGIGRVMHLFNRCSLSAFDSDGEDIRVNALHLFLARSAPCPLEVRMAYPSLAGCHPGWRVFDGHFDRATVFEVTADDEAELRNDILPTVATGMKRLQRFKLDTMDFNISTKNLDQWEPQNLPHLGHLIISGHLFCRATTLPSLHTVDLIDRRYIESLPTLLPVLEMCPALTTLSLHLATNHRANKGKKRQTPERIASLPRLHHLNVTGTRSEIYRFLSFLSFPSTTHVDLTVTDLQRVEDLLSILPNTLPPRHSGLYTSPHIDRLYLYSGTWHRDWNYSTTRCLSIRLYVQGNERLHVAPAFPFTYARNHDDLLRFMGAFRACTLTELALNLECYSPIISISYTHPHPFWGQFFRALPYLRRLELLSPSVDPREQDSPQEMDRVIAHEFLKATKARGGTSLAWVLRAFKGYPRYLEDELSNVEDVLDDTVDSDASERLGRLELYIMTADEHDYYHEHRREPIDLTQITTDRTASRLVTRAYVAGLEKTANVVFIGGGWGFAEDDNLGDLDATSENEDSCADMTD